MKFFCCEKVSRLGQPKLIDKIRSQQVYRLSLPSPCLPSVELHKAVTVQEDQIRSVLMYDRTHVRVSLCKSDVRLGFIVCVFYKV